MQPESLILLALLGGLLFLMINRTRRQQREMQNLQAQLAVGQRVITTAGLYATIVELDADSVTLETAPGQCSRWDRRAVARLVIDDAAPGAETAQQADGGAGERPEPEYSKDDVAGSAASSQDTAPPDRA